MTDQQSLKEQMGYLRNRKRQLEQELSSDIYRSIATFSRETGIAVKDISCAFRDVSGIGEDRNHYLVEVSVDLDLA